MLTIILGIIGLIVSGVLIGATIGLAAMLGNNDNETETDENASEENDAL